jgi:hypothetical protein
MFAAIDGILPPILLWSIFSIIWFLAPSIAITIRGEKVSGIPSLITASAIVFGLFVAGTLFIGPLGFILLLIACLCFSAVIISGRKSRTWSKGLALDLQIIGLVGWFFFVVLVGSTVSIHQSRTYSDYILKWEATWPGQRLLKGIASSGPQALSDLRKILKNAEFGPTLEIAAEGFQAFGEPETDVPLLIDALAKCADLGNLSCTGKVEAALRELSGLDLPEGTADDVWWKNWDEIQIEDFNSDGEI